MAVPVADLAEIILGDPVLLESLIKLHLVDLGERMAVRSLADALGAFLHGFQCGIALGASDLKSGNGGGVGLRCVQHVYRISPNAPGVNNFLAL